MSSSRCGAAAVDPPFVSPPTLFHQPLQPVAQVLPPVATRCPMPTPDPRSHDELTGDLGGEPMSIAEEIAAEVRLEGEDAVDRYESLKKTDTHITALQKMSMQELIELAREEQIGDITGVKKHDLVFRILKERVKLNGLMFGEGTLEILPDGFGFLRSPEHHYLSCPDDIYVSPSQVRRFGLRNGMSIAGQTQLARPGR